MVYIYSPLNDHSINYWVPRFKLDIIIYIFEDVNSVFELFMFGGQFGQFGRWF